jgi:hypothetical protein
MARAAKQAGVQRFIHISALNASEDSPSQFLQSKVNLMIYQPYVTLYCPSVSPFISLF